MHHLLLDPLDAVAGPVIEIAAVAAELGLLVVPAVVAATPAARNSSSVSSVKQKTKPVTKHLKRTCCNIIRTCACASCSCVN